MLLPACGSLAAVLVALVVVLGGGTSVSDHPGADPTAVGSAETEDATSAAGSTARDEAVPSAETATSSRGGGAGAVSRQGAPAAPGASSAARANSAPVVGSTRTARKVQQSASLALETPADEFADTTAAVTVTVARLEGIVASSQIGESDASGGEATYDLRIPTDKLDRALAALSQLGHVVESSRSLDDITRSFTSAQERLTEARAERRGLLRALARATTQQQIDSLKAQLRTVASKIRARKGQLASLRRRADLSTVSLTVRGTGERSETGGGGSWTPGEAAGDALRVLEVLAGIALIGLAVLVPTGLIAAAIAFGVRFGRRRRREAALDPA
jgi:hypothetical protein